jgi:hypothetical protein
MLRGLSVSAAADSGDNFCGSTCMNAQYHQMPDIVQEYQNKGLPLCSCIVFQCRLLGISGLQMRDDIDR